MTFEELFAAILEFHPTATAREIQSIWKECRSNFKNSEINFRDGSIDEECYIGEEHVKWVIWLEDFTLGRYVINDDVAPENIDSENCLLAEEEWKPSEWME